MWFLCVSPAEKESKWRREEKTIQREGKTTTTSSNRVKGKEYCIRAITYKKNKIKSSCRWVCERWPRFACCYTITVSLLFAARTSSFDLYLSLLAVSGRFDHTVPYVSASKRVCLHTFEWERLFSAFHFFFLPFRLFSFLLLFICLHCAAVYFPLVFSFIVGLSVSLVSNGVTLKLIFDVRV